MISIAGIQFPDPTPDELAGLGLIAGVVKEESGLTGRLEAEARARTLSALVWSVIALEFADPDACETAIEGLTRRAPLETGDLRAAIALQLARLAGWMGEMDPSETFSETRKRELEVAYRLAPHWPGVILAMIDEAWAQQRHDLAGQYLAKLPPYAVAHWEDALSRSLDANIMGRSTWTKEEHEDLAAWIRRRSAGEE